MAWFAGVVHTDGYLYFREGRVKELRLRVSEPSIEMLACWKICLDTLTGKRHSLLVEPMYDSRYGRTFEQYLVREGSVSAIMRVEQSLNVIGSSLFYYRPPDLAFKDSRVAGAYLAGVVDGDGCFQIRPRRDAFKPELLLKIASASSEPLKSLQSLLFSQGLSIGYVSLYSNHADLWVYASRRFRRWFEANAADCLTIARKRFKFKILERAPWCLGGGLSLSSKGSPPNVVV